MLLKQLFLKTHEYKSILITLNVFGSMVTSDYRCRTIFHMLVHAQSFGRLAKQNQKNCKKITPNIYKLIEILRKEQAATEITIRQLKGGGIIRARRIKLVKRDEEIQKLKTELENGFRI